MSGSVKPIHLITVLLLFSLPVLFACSEKITSASELELELRIYTSVNAPAGITQASSFLLIITGPGIERPIRERLIYDNGLLIGTVLVPAGPRRRFRVETYDERGALLYAGQAIADVRTGSRMELTISLLPQIPMIRVSPHYVSEAMGTLLAMTVQVYNIPNLNTIEGLIDNSSDILATILHADSVVLHPEIADIASLTWWDTDVSVYFMVEHRNQDGRIVDDAGHADLLTAYYRTSSMDVYPVETFHFHPSLISLVNRDGISIPIENMRADTSTVELWDYSARRISYWHMGWGTGSEDWYWIEDLSNNELHGTATGTTFAYGIYGDAREFDGEDDYIEVPDDDLLDIDGEITIALWASMARFDTLTTLCGACYSLVSKRNEGGAINYQLMVEDTSRTDDHASILFRYGGPVYHTYQVNIPEELMTGWRQIIFSYKFGDPSSALLAFGGGWPQAMEGEWVIGDGRAPAPVTGGSLFIGKDNAPVPLYFDGIMDNVELFDMAFDIYAIQHNFEVGW